MTNLRGHTTTEIELDRPDVIESAGFVAASPVNCISLEVLANTSKLSTMARTYCAQLDPCK